ncbi:MAG: hypothetical protein JXR37_25900 [Kiritimatiellae bacterium]|nr:hypothetical protein [Kiritimatiellia bacterium]
MALVILAAALVIVVGTFSGVVKAWRRGTELVEDLRHGDFVFEQVTSALRSAAFFHTSPGTYGFWYQSGGDRDEISWVCSGGALAPRSGILAEGMHRVLLEMGSADDGGPALVARSWSVLADCSPEEVEPIVLSDRVEGFDCRIGVFDEDTAEWEWTDTWDDEQTNTLPHRLLITLTLVPLEYGEVSPKLQRIVEIPLGPLSTGKRPPQPSAPPPQEAPIRGPGTPPPRRVGPKARGSGGTTTIHAPAPGGR